MLQRLRKLKLWYRHRAGRITASNFKAASRTNLSQPSLSLINRICYPESYKFSTEATRWGCEHEAVTREEYCNQVKRNHLNYSIMDSGLIIHPDYPYLGASPDGLISCDCCGRGTLEVKCPFSCRDNSIVETSEKTAFCLDRTSEGDFELNKKHAYYYQVQLQIKLSGCKYSDFVVWSESELVILRITLDEEYLAEAIANVTFFFKYSILPELLAKWYTKPHLPSKTTSDDAIADSSESESLEKWCYCRRGEDVGDMIMCESKKCAIEWFHLECLRITHAQIPKGKWYCPDCRKTVKKKKVK